MAAAVTALRLFAKDSGASCFETFEIARRLRDFHPLPPSGPLTWPLPPATPWCGYLLAGMGRNIQRPTDLSYSAFEAG